MIIHSKSLIRGVLIGGLLALAVTFFVAAQPAGVVILDDTAGFVHLSPTFIHTTNGCDQFDVSVSLSVTDAHAFSLRIYFDTAALELISVTPGPDTTLYLMPDSLIGDTLFIDGFFFPNYPAGSVTVATLHARAIAASDFTTHIGYIAAEGLSGQAEAPEPIIFSGDSMTVLIEGTQPLAPESLLVVRHYRTNVHQVDSLELRWNPVRLDMDGDPVVNPLYVVYFEDVVNDTSFIAAETYDTILYNDYIKGWYVIGIVDSIPPYDPTDTLFTNVGTYTVRACKTQP